MGCFKLLDIVNNIGDSYYTCKFLFPNKVTFTSTRGEDLDMSF